MTSVRLIKGPLRPIVGEHERARILAALSAVDAVVVFNESTPLKLIEAIRPDVLVKGGDYREEAVVGAREVRAWGGRVELIPLVEGISTTRLIARATPQSSLEADLGRRHGLIHGLERIDALPLSFWCVRVPTKLAILWRAHVAPGSRTGFLPRDVPSRCWSSGSMGWATSS